MRKIAIVLLTIVNGLSAQSQPAKSFVGTVAGFKPETAEVEIKPDNAAPVTAKFSAGTIAQKIAPGEKDLKKAEPIQVTDVAIGDRVLVTLEADGNDVRRIVVMSATDIAKRNEADRLDWQKRGVTGIVAKKSGNEITLKMKSPAGDMEAVVTVAEGTSFKRYAPDSVKFAEAQASKLAEVSVGDQLRARGQKSDDGLKVTADDVVFGTFQTKAGAITAVNVESKEITVKELGTGKSLTVKLTADSQVKKMPDMPAMTWAADARAPGAMPGRGAGGFDLSQMLERMPAAKLEDLKPGETIVVSSTKGARNDQLTAIMLLGNADMLIQMASMTSGGGSRGGGWAPVWAAVAAWAEWRAEWATSACPEFCRKHINPKDTIYETQAFLTHSLSLATGAALAQTPAAPSLHGTITDPSGALVPRRPRTTSRPRRRTAEIHRRHRPVFLSLAAARQVYGPRDRQGIHRGAEAGFRHQRAQHLGCSTDYRSRGPGGQRRGRSQQGERRSGFEWRRAGPQGERA